MLSGESGQNDPFVQQVDFSYCTGNVNAFPEYIEQAEPTIAGKDRSDIPQGNFLVAIYQQKCSMIETHAETSAKSSESLKDSPCYCQRICLRWPEDAGCFFTPLRAP